MGGTDSEVSVNEGGVGRQGEVEREGRISLSSVGFEGANCE